MKVIKKATIAAILMLICLSSMKLSAMQQDQTCPYSGERFKSITRDSYKYMRSGKPDEFYRWMERSYKTHYKHLLNAENTSLNLYLIKEKQYLTNIKNKKEKANMEMQLGGCLHKYIKSAITKFSLERGFEFYNTVSLGERQCFLQSVIIAGLAQDMGVNAGVVMVYKNIEGAPTNNGHAVALFKLAEGKDIIVDASDPIPFVEQKGLFGVSSCYRYVEPVYEKKTSKILFYRREDNKKKILTNNFRTLDFDFIKSQFDYYRGERAVGGVISAHKTNKGLEISATALRRSIKTSPGNSLAVYMLGRCYLAQGKNKEAQKLFVHANNLYEKYGWVPAGLKDVLK